MKVKKFLASNNHEALNLVKNELGSDAVILYQRKVKPKGLFGFFKQPMIEILAAIEEKSIYNTEKINNSYQSATETLRSKVDNSKKEELSTAEVNKEVSEIKGMLNTVINKINQQQLSDSIKTTDNKEIINLLNLLKKQGLEDNLIEEIINNCIVLQKQKPTIMLDKQLLKLEIEKTINKYIISKGKNYYAKHMFFVGPTGVGKTTTIAKLAAQYSINEGKAVGLISADTYRIAAVQQLKTFSDILNVPLEVVYNSSEIHDAIKRLRDKDIIMIDTAGRSHNDHKQILELKRLLDEIEEKEIHLVLSCTTKDSDIKEILNTYSFIDNYNIIFTKIDEANSFGTILNTAKNTKRPISYITTGQSVPDDIEEINVEKIVSLLIKEALP